MNQRLEQRRLPRLLLVTVAILVMAVAAVVTGHSSLSAARGAPGASVQVHVPFGGGSARPGLQKDPTARRATAVLRSSA